MKLFRFIRRGTLVKEEHLGEMKENSFTPIPEEVFESDEIVPLEVDGFLDTTDPKTIAKYKNNVSLLLKEALDRGKIDRFLLIHDDNFFPYDWMWRASEGSVYGEYKGGNLTYQLRMMCAEDQVIPKDGRMFPVLTPKEIELVQKKARELDPLYGRLFQPVEFRSTKHFTVNTPLGYTGDYNSGITDERNYTVIDTMDAFLNSGYGYSLYYKDSYLDTTHERLPISEDAIVLINRDKYEELIKDEKVKEQLKQRKVVLYKGDEATAINMILSQKGILPYRPGQRIEYPMEMKTIFDESMIELAQKYNLEFAHNHGNIDGRGGHFTDLLDQNRVEHVASDEKFLEYLKKQYPGVFDDVERYQLRDCRSIIERIGYQKMVDTILQYNEESRMKIEKSRREYDLDKDSITPEIHELFVSTVQLVRQMFAENYFSTIDPEEANALKEDIMHFYQEIRVKDQVFYAKKIQDYYQKKNGVAK